jgi:hypothetical protein
LNAFLKGSASLLNRGSTGVCSIPVSDEEGNPEKKGKDLAAKSCTRFPTPEVDNTASNHKPIN